MSDTPFMQLYIADYLGDTQHLTTEQHGAYLLILMAMWRAGGYLPNDPKKLARIARVSPRRWHILATEIMGFFEEEGDQITQKRLRRERDKAREISDKRAEAGRRGGVEKAKRNVKKGDPLRPKRSNNPVAENSAKSLKHNWPDLANATVLLKHSQKPYKEKDFSEEIEFSFRVPRAGSRTAETQAQYDKNARNRLLDDLRKADLLGSWIALASQEDEDACADCERRKWGTGINMARQILERKGKRALAECQPRGVA